ncbi:MAG: FlgO family outer membrane protein [Paraglaciecola sp.]|uniref:FlgO family outer membrane protein n=1 Tax=Paraglaciecola sp. TaxID=1920173 RepID=UPI00329A62A8
MLQTKKLVSILLLTASLGACSSIELTQDSNKRLCAKDDGTFYTCQDMVLQQKEITEATSHPSLFTTDLHFNGLDEYTEQMAAELQQDVRGIEVDQAIVVASFVNLDSSLQNTNTIGIQLAESFINELQQIGLPVSDHKIMGKLDVNGRGDFAFSRDMEQLSNNVNIGYVLTGTMLQNSRGILVNARLINFKTNVVAASSSKFLPNVVISNLM